MEETENVDKASELKMQLESKNESLQTVFKSLNSIGDIAEFQHLLDSCGDLLAKKILENLEYSKEIGLTTQTLLLVTRLYPILPEAYQTSIRSIVLSTVFSTSTPAALIHVLACTRILAQIFLFHRQDEQINDLVSQYFQFISNNLSTGNLSHLTSLLNIIPSIVDLYTNDMISMLVRLSEQLSSTLDKPEFAFRRQSIRKTIKNILCAILKSRSELSQKLSFGIMDCLVNQIRINKQDTYQFYQILQTRGFNYQQAGKIDPSAMQLSKDQISSAVVAALQHYANTNNPNMDQFILPQDANVSNQVVTEIIITALNNFNPLGHADNGLQHWSQIVSSIQHFAQQALQIQIQMLSQVTSVMDTSKSARNKFIPTTQPFSLYSIAIANPDDNIKEILKSLLDSFDTIPCDKLLENDGSHLLLQRKNGAKRKLDQEDAIFFANSRAHWTMLLSRIFSNSIFSNYKELFVDFVLSNFPNRFDLAVRWLWESFYLEYIYTTKKEKQEHVDLEVKLSGLYKLHLEFFLETMFSRAENALPNSETFIPWIQTTNKQNLTHFKQFFISLPKLNVSADYFSMITRYLDVEFSIPLPTPIQTLQYNFALEILFELIIHKPVQRKLLPLLLSNVFKVSGKRTHSLALLKRFWTGEGFGYENGFFLPVYLSIERLALDLFRSLAHDKPPSLNSPDLFWLIKETFEFVDYVQEWSIGLIESVVEFYLHLVQKKPELISVVFELIPVICEETKHQVNAGITSFFISMGIPKDENDLSYKLLLHIKPHMHSEVVKYFFITIVKNYMNYPPTEGIYPAAVPSKIFTRFVLDILSEFKDLDPELYIAIINGDGFTREEMYIALHHLVSIQPSQFTFYVAQILRPPSLLSPVELILFINNCCELPGRGSVNPKRSGEAISLLIEASSTGAKGREDEIQMITTKSIASAIGLMMANYASGTYPLLFMKTVLAYLVKYGQDVRGFILSQVLAPLCNLRLLWLAARDKLIKTEEIRVGKVLWHSFILCLKECIPNSFMLVMQLQKDRLALVLQKAGDEYKKEFRVWCESEKQGPRAKKIAEILHVLKE